MFSYYCFLWHCRIFDTICLILKCICHPNVHVERSYGLLAGLLHETEARNTPWGENIPPTGFLEYVLVTVEMFFRSEIQYFTHRLHFFSGRCWIFTALSSCSFSAWLIVARSYSHAKETRRINKYAEQRQTETFTLSPLVWSPLNHRVDGEFQSSDREQLLTNKSPSGPHLPDCLFLFIFLNHCGSDFFSLLKNVIFGREEWRFFQTFSTRKQTPTSSEATKRRRSSGSGGFKASEDPALNLWPQYFSRVCDECAGWLFLEIQDA